MILIGCCVLTGCQQTKSFMHMNSDSPSPFFGLQLAVDRNSPAVQVPSLRNDAANSDEYTIPAPASYLTKARGLSGGQQAAKAEYGTGANSNFSFTATEDVLRGDLKMALPKATPKSGSQEADQLADLLHRLKQS